MRSKTSGKQPFAASSGPRTKFRPAEKPPRVSLPPPSPRAGEARFPLLSPPASPPPRAFLLPILSPPLPPDCSPRELSHWGPPSSSSSFLPLFPPRLPPLPPSSLSLLRSHSPSSPPLSLPLPSSPPAPTPALRVAPGVKNERGRTGGAKKHERASFLFLFLHTCSRTQKKWFYVMSGFGGGAGRGVFSRGRFKNMFGALTSPNVLSLLHVRFRGSAGPEPRSADPRLPLA
jgi:hypothetical protein